MINHTKKIQNCLISVYDKTKLESLAKTLDKYGVNILSTDGTKKFIENIGINCTAIENITTYPSIFGGRVKTLHPKIFGGILYRRNNNEDVVQQKEFDIPEIDMVVVDLYPFEKVAASTDEEAKIIEMIDIGGISLIRAAAKNFKDVLIIPSADYFESAIELIENNKAETNFEQRKSFALKAFEVSSHYDSCIFKYFNRTEEVNVFKQSERNAKQLRYGENPHQEGTFFGKIEDVLEKLWGKELSYNNLLDVDSAVKFISDFDETTFAVIKHNNTCGAASRDNIVDAYKEALAGDPISAYGGVFVTNAKFDESVAEELNKMFFEVIIAPEYTDKAIEILKIKKNRIILKLKNNSFGKYQFRSALNGILQQSIDSNVETVNDLQTITTKTPEKGKIEDLLFANKIVKHLKSNAIVLVKDKQLLASGVGQTSRVDALRQAITKAGSFGFGLKGAVMASDAFFPFPDCVEIAHQAGITAVIQPGGSIRDTDSVEFCNKNNMAMVVTGIRHFKH